MVFRAVANWWDGVPAYIRTAIIVVALFLIAMKLASWMMEPRGSPGKPALLLRHAARWAAAAEQDASPLMAMMHSNYASAYLQVLKELYTPAELGAAAGVDFPQLEERIMAMQGRVQTQLVEACPALQPTSTLEAYSWL